ncbi:MAG TPA: hypothetical protein VI874_00045, partial [Candidatus Norongarragalinales archaeon]|nr:hypothetical protein [Candidatus Norongarragalinales archaeon]
MLEPLKKAYTSIEDAYYSFMEWLQEHGVPVFDYFVKPLEEKGIPSFPVLFLLITGLLAAVFLLVSGVAAGPRDVSITVVANSSAIDGALVELLLEGSVFDSQTTIKGRSFFQSVPAVNLEVHVNKTGYPVAFRTLRADMRSLRVDLTQIGTHLVSDTGDSLVLYVVERTGGQPVAGASIRYNSAVKTGQELTDLEGKAELPKAPLTNIRVFKPGYFEEVLTVRNVGTMTVFLTRIGQTISDFSDLPPLEKDSDAISPIGPGSFVTATVNVKESQLGYPVNASVSIYSVDSEILAQGSSEGGSVIFRLAPGPTAYVAALADGYALYDGSSLAQPMTQDVTFNVLLDRFGTSNSCPEGQTCGWVCSDASCECAPGGSCGWVCPEGVNCLGCPQGQDCSQGCPQGQNCEVPPAGGNGQVCPAGQTCGWLCPSGQTCNCPPGGSCGWVCPAGTNCVGCPAGVDCSGGCPSGLVCIAPTPTPSSNPPGCVNPTCGWVCPSGTSCSCSPGGSCGRVCPAGVTCQGCPLGADCTGGCPAGRVCTAPTPVPSPSPSPVIPPGC